MKDPRRSVWLGTLLVAALVVLTLAGRWLAPPGAEQRKPLRRWVPLAPVSYLGQVTVNSARPYRPGSRYLRVELHYTNTTDKDVDAVAIKCAALDDQGYAFAETDVLVDADAPILVGSTVSRELVMELPIEAAGARASCRAVPRARLASARGEARELPAPHADGTLGQWRAASQADQIALAKVMIRRITTGLSERDIAARALVLERCVDDVAGSGGLDSLKIAEIAGTCAALIKLQE